MTNQPASFDTNIFQFARIDGHRIAFQDHGHGRPVILIHGIPTSSHLWRGVIPSLARDHRVIAPDLLNYGRSDKPETADVSIAAQAEMIARLMDALGVRRADVVAHDIGGGVAQILAVRYPEKVDRLVLIDSVSFDSWPIPEFEPLQAPEAEANLSLEAFLGMMREFMPQGVEDKAALPAEIVEAYLEPFASESGKRAFFRNLRRLNKEYTQAIAEELTTLPHQTLVIWGDKDPFQKPCYAERLVQTLPDARLIWIENAGHWLLEEKPGEIAGHISAFLTPPPVGGAA
jgi:pimeloyl-ACP methyl ester carboxylesterase